MIYYNVHMIDTKTITLVKQILFRYLEPKDYSLFIFGSRASGENKKYSDIDIGVEGKKPVKFLTLAKLQDAFEESNLPYIIDLVDFATVSDSFKKIAKKNSIALN